MYLPVISVFEPRLIESDRLTGQDKEQERNQGAVTHIEDGTSHTTKAESHQPEKQRVPKHESAAGACGPETAPLPVIVFATEQEIHHQDSDCRAAHDHEPVADKEEAEHIVHLVEPDAVHYEMELDEDGGEREDTDNEHAWDRAEVAGTGWNLAGDLIRTDGCLHGLERLANSS